MFLIQQKQQQNTVAQDNFAVRIERVDDPARNLKLSLHKLVGIKLLILF